MSGKDHPFCSEETRQLEIDTHCTYRHPAMEYPLTPGAGQSSILDYGPDNGGLRLVKHDRDRPEWVGEYGCRAVSGVDTDGDTAVTGGSSSGSGISSVRTSVGASTATGKESSLLLQPLALSSSRIAQKKGWGDKCEHDEGLKQRMAARRSALSRLLKRTERNT